MVSTKAQASEKPTTCRMFESDFLEWFSRIHPATPFVAWLPVITWMIVRAVNRAELVWWAIAGTAFVGFVAWTLAEYVLHRYVFHWVNDSAFGKRFHFLLHGVHHDYPTDKDRLVMPLGASIPMGVFFYFAFLMTMGVRMSEPFFAGFVLGYLFYDGTHYAIHHFRLSGPIWKMVRKHHMLHHYTDHDGGFGVSSPLWDIVFRTMPAKRAVKG
ncbi:MAG: sterol desaturase family protein [Polyangiaceae bacterium]|nr:sterol desaturase family protein [Polyangiaceae bacterium]